MCIIINIRGQIANRPHQSIYSAGINDHVRAANSLTALLLIGWGDVVRLRLPNQKARVKVARVSCFFYREQFSRSFWDGGNSEFRRLNMQSEFRFRSRATKRNIEQKAQAKSTKKATEWGLKKFDKWCEKRAIKVDLKTIDKKELNKILRKFYAEVKTEKGQALTPSALTRIRAAIHRL